MRNDLAIRCRDMSIAVKTPDVTAASLPREELPALTVSRRCGFSTDLRTQVQLGRP
jgi:hypothetical protein